MRVVCAWCEKEGRPPVLREDEAGGAALETHGICEAHSVKLLRDAATASRFARQGCSLETAR